jgi:hypothetical protein
MSSDVIPIDRWYRRRWVRPAVVARVLVGWNLARFVKQRGQRAEEKAQRGGSTCEPIRVRNDLALWPKPGAMC